MRLLFLLLCFLCFKNLFSQKLTINEIVSKNTKTYLSLDSQSHDWIELYNNSSDTLELSNYFLSDKENHLLMWMLPNIKLNPFSHFIVFASGKNSIEKNQVHTNFQIKSEGEDLFLTNNKGEIIDFYPGVSLQENESFGRFPDGSLYTGILQDATPGQANDLIQKEYSHLSFSKEAGFYKEKFNLSIQCSFPNTTIRFTIDGSDPISSSFEYNDSIYINSKSNEENVHSEISTSDDWSPPKNQVFKGHTIKAAAFFNEKRISDIYCKSYFILPQSKNYSLPVVSLISDFNNFFDPDSGIYVKGNYFNFKKRGVEWERPTSLEYFDEKGALQFSQKAGIRINGNKSRTSPQKSLQLFAKEIYDKKKFEYAFFDNDCSSTFNRIKLRSASGSDWKFTMFKNELAQKISSNLDLELACSKPVLVFINGEYWGIHHLTEKINDDYFSDYFDIDKEEVNILSFDGVMESGNSDSYREMIRFISNNDLQKEENFLHVADQINLSNYIDYNCAEIFFSNKDWPNNNVRYWKPQNKSKWRWLFFDCDACMGYEYYDILQDFTFEENYSANFQSWSTFLLHNLLKNDSFKLAFRSRFEYLLNNDFSFANISKQIDEFVSVLDPEVNEHCDRWRTPENKAEWLGAIEGLYSFASFRPQVMRQQLTQFFGKPFTVFPNPARNEVNILINIDKSSLKKIQVKNILGKYVYKSSSQNYSSIDLSHLKPGIYMMEVLIGSSVYFQKIVLQ